MPAIPLRETSSQSSQLSTRGYHEGDELQILELHERVFGPGRPASSSGMDLWRWLYQASPHGSRISLLLDGDRIVAHYAAIPLTMSWFGQDVIGAHCIDSMVDPRLRRGLAKGAPFQMVTEAYYKHFGDLPQVFCNYGFPNRSAFRIGVSRLDYLPCFEPIASLYINAFEPFDLRRVAGGNGLRVDAITQFDRSADQLWQRVGPLLGFAIKRDATYLNWRYANSPISYHSVAVRDARGLRALAVFRSQWGGQPILALVDYLGPKGDQEALAAVIHYGMCHLQEWGCMRLEAWFHPESWWFGTARALGMNVQDSLFRMVCRIRQHPHRHAEMLKAWYYTIGDTDAW